MKLFEFAIASIVDANTGYLARGSGNTGFRAHEQRAHEIRSRAFHGFFESIGKLVRDTVADYRERARQRKAIEDLSYLNDHYLDDIGLTRGDIAAVKLGQTSLQVLNDDRRARLAVAPLDYVETREVDSLTGATDAVNEREYAGAKCA